MKRFLISALTLCTLCVVEANDTIRAKDFGITPDTYINYAEPINRLIDSSRNKDAVIVFEPGRYDIWTDGAVRKEIYITNTSSETECPSKEKTIGMFLSGLKNVVIDGNGATFMMHGNMTPLAAIGCENVTLKNFNIDFERPGGSELRYTAAKPGSVEVEVHRDTRYTIEGKRLKLIGEGWKSNKIHCIKYTPDNKHFVYSNDWNVLSNCDVEETAFHKLRFSTPEGFMPETGATITLRDIIRSQVGMLLLECKDMALEQLNVRYMHGLGIVSQYTRNVRMTGVNCKPSDSSGRLLASSADFMHFSGCSGAVVVEKCNFAGTQDDCINVHGTNLQVQEILSEKSATVRFMHHQSYGYNAYFEGDTVAFVNPRTMLREATAIVAEVERLNPRNIRLTFTTPIPKNVAAKATCVENLSQTPTLLVSDCHFTRTSTRGTLCTTPRKVVIQNNLFEHLGMSAILIEGDAEGWYESRAVTDVTIRNNRFIDCAYSGGPAKTTIALNPSNRTIDKKKPVHSNISITGNYFDTDGRPILFAQSTSNIRFIGNEIVTENPTFIFKGCSKIDIKPKNKNFNISESL